MEKYTLSSTSQGLTQDFCLGGGGNCMDNRYGDCQMSLCWSSIYRNSINFGSAAGF